MDKRWINVRIIFVAIFSVIALVLAFSGQNPFYVRLALGFSVLVVALISLVWRLNPHVKITEADANPNASPETLGSDEVNNTGVPVHDDSLVSEEAMRHGVLLECNNAWLSDKQLYYCRNFWNVADMVAAKVDGDDLSIKFINGKMERFVLTPDKNVSDEYRFKFVSENTKNEALSYHLRAKSRQWARVINELIWAKKTPPKQDTP
jgi:hypothetical protein